VKEYAPSAPVYPELPAASEFHGNGAQTFVCRKLAKLSLFLRTEVESRSHLNKNYRRVVNTIDGACGKLAVTCIGTGAVGAGLLASGIRFVPGLALEVITGAAGLLDVAGVVVSRRCAVKAAKHEAVRVLAASKLNSVHSRISKALEDCIISDDEYKLVLEEVVKYRTIKEELRHKHAPGSSFTAIDEETKNELIKRGREQARASFIKKLATSESPSP